MDSESAHLIDVSEHIIEVFNVILYEMKYKLIEFVFWLDLSGTFHPDNPQSVASALHIRGLELKPKEEVSKLSDFEEEIYKFYARFRRTKALKVDADRPYIPDAKTLAQWYAVSRLIETPVNEMEDVPLKRKWKALKTENQIGQFGGTRKNKEMKRARLVATKVPRKTIDVGKPRRKYTRKEKPVEPPRKPVSTNEEGYILIPPEPDIQKAIKRGRPRKKDEEMDPEFVAEVSMNDEVGGISFEDMTPRTRRSRGPRKSYFDNDPDVEIDWKACSFGLCRLTIWIIDSCFSVMILIYKTVFLSSSVFCETYIWIKLYIVIKLKL